MGWWPDTVRVEASHMAYGCTFVVGVELTGDDRKDIRRLSMLRRVLWEDAEWTRLIAEGVDVPAEVKQAIVSMWSPAVESK